MTVDLTQFASIAGELAGNLFGRTDFEKYDAAWAEAHNWVVDYRGGLFTRAGFEFGDIVEWTEGEGIKFVEFQFSPDTANTYVVLFTDDKVRFIQDNAYVLEGDITVASLANSTGDDVEFTSNSHGLSNGDWVKLSGFVTNVSLNGRTAEVTDSQTNTVELLDPITGDIIEIASVSTETGTINRIYTITSPYGQEDLSELRAVQIRDNVRLTHPDYPIKNLIRTAATNWSIANEVIIPAIQPPTGLTASAADANNQAGVYQVTSVDEDGNESTPILDVFLNLSTITDTDKEIRLTWTAATNARRYNVYRSRINQSTGGTDVRTDWEVGFIGFAIGNTFVDPGITPDYTKQPPVAYNPFADGRIEYVEVDVAGTGFEWDDTITWPAGGSDAFGYVISSADTSGTPIYGILLLNGGKDYTGTSVSVAGGSGETLTAVLSAASGNNPHCAAIFQQRMVYAATDNDPLRIYGSRTGLLSNFNYTLVGADDDSYEFDLDAPKIAPIRHLVAVRGGLLVFNQLGVWIVSGRNGATLTGNNAEAEPQNNVGASLTEPTKVDQFVIYVSDAGQELRQLIYDDFSKVYGGKNISLLSNHLFKPTIEINSLTYAPVPSKVLYATQTNGRLIAATIDNENSVFAVTPQWTQGYFRYCMAVEEDNENRLYVAVEREINGNRVMFFERLERRENFDLLEESFCVDAGLSLTRTKPAAKLTPSSLTNTVTFTASASVFVSGDVGKVIRCGDGKATITAYASGTSVSGLWSRDLTKTFPEKTTPAEFASGEWTLDEPVTAISGLWHLEGEAVSILADGEVVTGKTVSNGALTLDLAASAVSIGLGFTCRAKTLPVTTTDVPVEGRRKILPEVAIRMYKSNGLKLGKSPTKLYSIADRTQTLFGTANKLRTEIVLEPLKNDWTRDNQIYFIQNTPQPAAILSIIRDVDVGDGKE